MAYGNNTYVNDFRKIEQDLKTGGIDASGPILLCGSEGFLIEHYEKKLTNYFLDTIFPDLNLNIFYGDEASDDDIMGTCDTLPMVGEYRVVVSRDNLGLSSASSAKTSASSKQQLLEKYVSQSPESTALIFTSHNLNKKSKLYTALKTDGKIYELNRLSEDDLILFVKKRFKKSKLNVNEKVLSSFIFLSSYLEKDSDKDLFSLTGEITKICTFVSSEGRTEVTFEDLSECMESNLQSDVFTMLDAISTNRKAEAIRQLETTLAQGSNIFQLTALFTGHFEIMLGYKEMSAKDYPKSKMMNIMNVKSDYRLKKLGQFSDRFTIKDLMKILHRFYSIERDIKSGNISENLALTILLSDIG